MIAAWVTLAAALVTGVSPPESAARVPEAPPVEAPTDARTEAARGEALFGERRFDEASAAYQRAYELDPVPAFLFARARSEQEAGRCESAIEVYRSFIATSPPASDVDRANLEIGRCYGETRAAEPPPPRVEPPPLQKPAAVVAPEPRKRAAWVRDPIGGGLFGGGLVLLGSGLGMYFAGDAKGDRAQRAATTDEFRDKIGPARLLQGIGIGVIGVGSALLVAAITRYAVIARKHRRPRAH